VLGILSPINAQTPPKAEEPAVKLGGIRFETASLPGSTLKWTKVLATFTTHDQWLDGLVFTAVAVMGEKDSFRVVTGSVRYGNVTAGTHTAVFYISPRATARFGTPVAVEVTAFQRDTEVDTASWKADGASKLPADWKSLNTYQGILVNVMNTPWIMLDYEKSPDVIVIH
jgi:hypothetical protein